MLALLAALFGTGCSSGFEVAWQEIPDTPDAEPYEGSIETILSEQLSRELAEDLEVIDSRVEYLPPGVDFQTHREWRSENAAGLDEEIDRLEIPDQDPPASVAKFSDGTSTLLVIARADDAGERLVVLTALATSR